MRGPIDYVIVGFDGNSFDGGVLKALEKAIYDGVIALVSLIFITKDKFGGITTLDVEESDDEYIVKFTEKYQTSPEHITSDDVEEVGELLDNNASAGLLVIEQLWAIPLKTALIKAGGYLLGEGRIHPDPALELDDAEEE